MSSTRKDHDVANIAEALATEIAYIPGGRDKENRPLIVLDVPAGELSPIARAHLDSLLEYFLTIFSEETKSNGLTLLVDARAASCRSSRSYVRQARERMGNLVSEVIAVRPDSFWEKQRVDNYCTKIHRDGEPIYVSLSRLSAYVDPNQLTYNLGGSKSYDHIAWIQNRMRIDEFLRDAENLISKLNDQKERLNSGDLMSSKSDESSISSGEPNLELAAQQVLRTGRHLTSLINRETAQDALDTVQRIHHLMEFIEQKQLELERAWSDVDKNIDILRDIENLEAGVASVTNWILGPADSMLNAHYQIGFDVASSEELRREHEKLELECRDTYGKYAEILHKLDGIPSNYLSEDLKSQRDFMDFVCRSFATRLERRRNVLITSQRFFRLVSEYFDKTSEVFDKLIMGNRSCDFSTAEENLQKLERYQQKLEGLEHELIKEGEKLSDVLSMPVKDALCRDVQIEYSEDIINIQDILDATNARKNIFNDSVELQKLTLKQTALVYTYESDAEQAVQWLNDLYDVLIGTHVEIGCNVTEIQTQKQDHQSFQDTAKGTYDYGCQLVNGARALRISCKFDLDDNTELVLRLRQIWRQLRLMGQEHLTRLRVCAVFHRNVDDHCTKLREMIEMVGSFASLSRISRSTTPSTCSPEVAVGMAAFTDSTSSTRVKSEIRDVLAQREKLLPEVGRTVRLGRLLRSRLKEPLAHQRMSEFADEASEPGGNLSAVQSISAKLLEVTRLAEKLDAKLYEVGARSQALNPAMEVDTEQCDDSKDEADGTKSAKSFTEEEQADVADNCQRGSRSEQSSPKETDIQSRTSDRSAVEDSNADEYVTATECSSTPVPRSRSESFLSSEYEDALVSTTCRKTEDEMKKEIEIVSETNNKVTIASANSVNEGTVEYIPDKATVVHRTIQDKDGKIIKETTETTTLRVTHNTHFGVASYKLVSNTITDNTDNLDYRELQDLNRTILDGCSNIPTPPPLPPAVNTYREEHTHVSPSRFINYMKSEAHGQLNGDHDDRIIVRNDTDQTLTRHSVIPADYRSSADTGFEHEILSRAKTVSINGSDEARSRSSSSVVVPIQQQYQQLAVAACTTALAAVEEFTMMPAASIAVCQLN